MTPRVKKYNEPSKTIGVRVPLSKIDYYREELNDYAMHLFLGGKTYKQLKFMLISDNPNLVEKVLTKNINNTKKEV